MDELLDLYHEATGAIYDGDTYGYNYEPRSRLTSQENKEESDIDEDILVETVEEDEVNEIPVPDDEETAVDDWKHIDLETEEPTLPVNFDFSEDVGPKPNNADTSSPYSFFSLFLSEEYFAEMAHQTNIYAEHRQAKANKVDTYWKPVTCADIKIYLYINYMMGIHILPESQMYWSSDDRLRVPGIADKMSRNRFDKISQYFHLNDPANEVPKGEDGHDPLYKVKPLLNRVKERSQALYTPGQHLSIDEAMIGFRGRLYFKQYIKGKPTPWGIKVWCLADPSCGYLLDMSFYTGKSDTDMANGLGYNVVMSLGSQYLNKGHHFFYDNFFSSVKLASDLLAKSTHSCSTVRTNRKGWPKELTDKATQKMQSGEIKIAQKGPLTATFWKDKRKVSVLSTNVTPSMESVARRAPGGHQQVLVPSPVLHYNKYMFGVDLADQLRSYYGMGRSGHKWWRYAAWFLFQVAMVNSWILYKMCNQPEPRQRRLTTQLQFRLDVLSSLVRGQDSRKRRAPDTPTTAGQTIAVSSEHQPITLHGLKKGCVQCRSSKRKTKSGRVPTTTNGCCICKVHLCKGLCFAQFHQQLQ